MATKERKKYIASVRQKLTKKNLFIFLAIILIAIVASAFIPFRVLGDNKPYSTSYDNIDIFYTKDSSSRRTNRLGLSMYKGNKCLKDEENCKGFYVNDGKISERDAEIIVKEKEGIDSFELEAQSYDVCYIFGLFCPKNELGYTKKAIKYTIYYSPNARIAIYYNACENEDSYSCWPRDSGKFGIMSAEVLKDINQGIKQSGGNVAKSKEQERYERECLSAEEIAKTSYSEEWPEGYDISKDTVNSFCSCLGEAFFPRRSELPVFPVEDGEHSFDKKDEIVDSCKIYKDERERYHGGLGVRTGSEEYIEGEIEMHAHYAYQWFSEDTNYGYNMLPSVECVKKQIYEVSGRPYFVEIITQQNVRDGILRCTNDSRLNKLSEYFFYTL